MRPATERSAAAGRVSEVGLEPIDRPYLLVTFIPYFVDEGAIWLDRLWHKDLLHHLSYLKRLTIAAPRILGKSRDEDLVRLDRPDVRFVPLPPMRSKKEGLRALPELARALWRAVGEAEIVHSGIAGWPYPLGWVANPIALLRDKTLLLVVESAPWRLDAAPDAGLLRKARAGVTEALGRFFVKRSDLVFFTHEGYRASFGEGHVMPASWIEDEDVLSDAAALESWRTKSVPPLRALFAGRLETEKGVEVLVAAHRLLATNRGARIEAIGAGELAPKLREAGIPLRAPVPYGPEFRAILREAHVLVVPSLSNEQPRILYDAAAQAVACVATDSEGNRSLIEPGKTGLLFPRGDADALAKTLAELGLARAEKLGFGALRAVRGHTHRAMHEKRWAIIRGALE